jgi:CRP-like cAMP-binding protein
MDINQPALNIRAPVWTHEPAARPQSIPQALEALAQPARYQRDEEIYSLERSVECWYQVVSGAARRFALRADGRQTVDLLLPDDFFGFGVRGKHAFTAEALADDTVIARYPVSRMETLAAPTPLQPENWPASSLAECRGCTPCS